MSVSTGLTRAAVGEFAARFRPEAIPLDNTFSYFSLSLPFTDEDLKEYLREPIAALPPSLTVRLPKTFLLLVPFLERANGKVSAEHDLVCMERPPENKHLCSARLSMAEGPVLVFSIREQPVADYHYFFYNEVARLAVRVWNADEQSSFMGLLREELKNHTHGEVDEESWRLKQALLRRQSYVRRESKPFREYAEASFADTLTLYLHGICCDIDVETGPRQLPSRLLRKRLQLLQGFFPPPEGYAVFPEDLKQG